MTLLEADNIVFRSQNIFLCGLDFGSGQKRSCHKHVGPKFRQAWKYCQLHVLFKKKSFYFQTLTILTDLKVPTVPIKRSAFI